ADGNFSVKAITKAIISHTGKVVWKPPMVLRSLCSIDVEFFPFDSQDYQLKLGSWTYDGFSIDVKH
ncbi:hypothetical protein A3Q56_03239, partial [Intoshia linei]